MSGGGGGKPGGGLILETPKFGFHQQHSDMTALQSENERLKARISELESEVRYLEDRLENEIKGT